MDRNRERDRQQAVIRYFGGEGVGLDCRVHGSQREMGSQMGGTLGHWRRRVVSRVFTQTEALGGAELPDAGGCNRYGAAGAGEWRAFLRSAGAVLGIREARGEGSADNAHDCSSPKTTRRDSPKDGPLRAQGQALPGARKPGLESRSPIGFRGAALRPQAAALLQPQHGGIVDRPLCGATPAQARCAKHCGCGVGDLAAAGRPAYPAAR